MVGHRPEWLTNVVHVPCKRRANKFLDANHKIKTGLESIPEGEDVLLMHDDMFLIEPYEPVRHYHGTLKDRINGMQSSRKKPMQKALQIIGEDALHFSLHYPIPFKNRGWEYKDVSYMNVLGNRSKYPKQETTDCKFNLEAITKKKIKGLPCFSTASENDRLLHLFEQLYPQKSEYER